MKYSILVGLPTAENLKIQIGSARIPKDKEEKQAIIRGRDLSTGLPRSIRISAGEVREALFPILNQILSAISDVIEETPPELLSDIAQRGIFLSGGVTQLPGLDALVTETIKMPCSVVNEPMNAVVKGCAKVLEDESLLKRVRVTGGVR